MSWGDLIWTSLSGGAGGLSVIAYMAISERDDYRRMTNAVRLMTMGNQLGKPDLVELGSMQVTEGLAQTYDGPVRRAMICLVIGVVGLICTLIWFGHHAQAFYGAVIVVSLVQRHFAREWQKHVRKAIAEDKPLIQTEFKPE